MGQSQRARGVYYCEAAEGATDSRALRLRLIVKTLWDSVFKSVKIYLKSKKSITNFFRLAWK